MRVIGTEYEVTDLQLFSKERKIIFAYIGYAIKNW